MYVLWKQGEPVSAAARAVTEEMKLQPSPAQATERLRKNFRRFREEKEKASRSMRPAQAGNTPLAQMVKQAQQAVKFLGPSGVEDLKGKVRSVNKDRDSILEAAERRRRMLKPKI
jgi:tRNA U54 and U55 pseudouridine synthase Pus10